MEQLPVCEKLIFTMQVFHTTDLLINKRFSDMRINLSELQNFPNHRSLLEFSVTLRMNMSNVVSFVQVTGKNRFRP